ncbi:MAG: TonB-dependent receptor, partial [Bacteroidota bacterium]
MRQITLLLLLLFAYGTSAQDSLIVDLEAVSIQAFRNVTVTSRIAGSIATLDAREIEEFPTNDLLPAMNRIPGVRFEQRAPGSYRISVRGSTLRAPFGVRNIKVYWNGIPLTEPGGDTQLNFLDVANVDRLELLKGPAGSLYGAGTAGTLLLRTDTLAAPLMAELAAGSFGFLRARAQVQSRGSQLRYAAQATDGYRDHSSLFRQTVQYGLNLNHGLRLHALYTDLSYDLPGGLNPQQNDDNPRQARPGSAETNASINYHNLLLGLNRDWRRGGWANHSTVYATGFYFDHPFNFDYKRETNLGAGGRTAFDRTWHLRSGALILSFGAEYQLQLRMANNFTNNDTRPGDLNFSDEIDTRQGILFGQAIWSTDNGWRVTAGLSGNTLRYDVDRTFDADGNTGRAESDFGTALSPRLAVLKELGGVNVYASVAGGFSPPTLDEFRTNEGSLNVDLSPERGTNYELGLKADRSRIRYEATAFYFRLTESISTFSDERDTRLFRNAGATDQFGLELAATWRANDWLELYASYTYHDFTYDDFVRDAVDVSGQQLPGTAPHVTNLIADFSLARGFYANVNWNYTDAIPLNDANTVFGDAYHLVRARAGWRGKRLEVFAGGSNLL